MTASAPSTAILWFRRDLRLADNPALQLALREAEEIVPVYIWAPDEEAPWAPGGASRWWLHHSLADLVGELEKRGSPLVIRSGDSLTELRRLAKETGAGAVYWNRLYEPAAIARDSRIKEALREDGLEAESANAALLIEPWQIKTGGGAPYRVFTPYWKAAQALLPTGRLGPVPQKLAPPAKAPASLPLDSLELLPRLPWAAGFSTHWQPGAAGARKRLERFADDVVLDYSAQRDQPAVDVTSGLSPHLHFGDIGPRQVLLRMQRAQSEEGGAGRIACTEHFLREIGWREFAHHLLFHFPQTPLEPLVEKYRPFPWRKPAEYAADLRAWQRGRTGIPIVDAGMRQLWATGIMHNRVRMIVASFLTKNLLIPWQEGARWFWDTLVDADLPNNTLGWQWTAGCGADAAPYFRVFNPVLQSQKFDPSGEYLRQWLPELAGLPAERLHVPGAHWPPIVDLAVSRQRALDAYTKIKTEA
ncbi:deoxyribodipyrimidine photo-lyase [Solimonas sp. K1W22B-7]|uniref:cryptochrome/photolyase family protein n=1 Tax=Solimonas sp. K1W22B-7 TaxID=2303331 RepID=UPI000E3308BF|nr:deoxyribodipyrimidine photo-lyase [Solimonas sp. K1W22B-7]AXQ28017.1 deoxyribodipyrimidine photo-lyase [Solimonas sp. K1W22B-7]